MLALAGCGQGGSAGTATPVKTVSDWFAIKVGDQTVQMQVALSEGEQERGLMERRDLGQDQGMIFVFSGPQPMSFWMHNTPTPLDVGYFDADGELKEVYPMYAFDERPVKSRSDRLQFALEMNLGWFSAHGVRPGAKLDLAVLKQAIVARGSKPEQFGVQ